MDYPPHSVASLNPHAQFKTSPRAILRSAIQYHQLIVQLVKRELVSRYRGSFIGFAWSFLTPLLMLAVYTIFFSVAGGARWKENGMSHIDFAVMLFVGLILHGFFAECLNRSPLLIVTNTNYVKKVVFPLEILSMVTVISALVNAAIGITVLLAAQLVIHHTIAWTAIFLPVILLPFMLLMVGMVWFLSALGVYVRDISYMTPLATSVLLFMSPVFYSVSSLPEAIQPWIQLNPLTFIIEEARHVLLDGQLPHWQGLALYSAVSLTLAYAGFWCFQHMRRGFSDVL